MSLTRILLSFVILVLSSPKVFGQEVDNPERVVYNLNKKLTATVLDPDQVQTEVVQLNDLGLEAYINSLFLKQEFYNSLFTQFVDGEIHDFMHAGLRQSDWNETSAAYAKAFYSGDNLTHIISGDVTVIYDSEATGLPPFDEDNPGRHYRNAGRDNVSPEFLQYVPQSVLYHDNLDPNGPNSPAGIFTNFKTGVDLIDAGTNRRPIYVVLKGLLGIKTMEEIKGPGDGPIRRDIPITEEQGNPTGLPGFQNACASCHNKMDGMMGAFAHCRVRGGDRLECNADGSPQNNKVNGNVSNPDGHVTVDNSWSNPMVGNDAYSEFQFASASGVGIKSFIDSIVYSNVFPMAMAQQAFEYICGDTSIHWRYGSDSEKDLLNQFGNYFVSENYNLRSLWTAVAVYCVSAES
jgi:hypothetical protein